MKERTFICLDISKYTERLPVTEDNVILSITIKKKIMLFGSS